MSRFLAELRYFWQQVRDGYPRQREAKALARILRQLMGLEFAAATPEECFQAAVVLADYHADGIGAIYLCLLARVGRSRNGYTLAAYIRRHLRLMQRGAL